MANNPFLHNDRYMRFFGGVAAENPIDPYISGYHFMFMQMPAPLKAYITQNISSVSGFENKDQDSKFDPEAVLNTHNLALTPPGVTINKNTMNSTGGFKWSTPTNMDVGDTVTVRYNEYSGVPIYRIHKLWLNFIRNTNLGITETGGETSNLYQRDYKATLLYATVRPDMKTMEFYAKFTGVFPSKSPTDVFASDVTTSDKLEIDMEYSIDFMYDNHLKVKDEIAGLINESRASGVKFNSERPTKNLTPQ